MTDNTNIEAPAPIAMMALRKIPDAPSAFVKSSSQGVAILDPSIVLDETALSNNLPTVANFRLDLPFCARARRSMQIGRYFMVCKGLVKNAWFFHRRPPTFYFEGILA